MEQYIEILYHCATSDRTGLPQQERSQLENIHFLSCSNKVDALELAEPLVTDLSDLEDGIVMYDALLGQEALVIAPVLFIIADNPMSSELCNHLGSTANKFCRICLVCITNQHMH